MVWCVLGLFINLSVCAKLLLLLTLTFILFCRTVGNFRSATGTITAIVCAHTVRPRLTIIVTTFFGFFNILLNKLDITCTVIRVLPASLLLGVKSARNLTVIFSVLLTTVV